KTTPGVVKLRESPGKAGGFPDDFKLNRQAITPASEMVVWGGRGGGGSTFNSGSRYDPLPDHWTATSTANGPAARWGQTVVWTGSEMLLFGGTTGPVLGDVYSYTPKRELYLYQRP
ncbi:MAG: hypothetical protein KJ070_25710, partial [Verrucomicrobia bacterium]|nr:hypothetical protein [Verrucomicrobiota bacterium]